VQSLIEIEMVIESEGDLDEAKGKGLRLVTPTSEYHISRTFAASQPSLSHYIRHFILIGRRFTQACADPSSHIEEVFIFISSRSSK
jgi:hypothetical protein